MERDNSKLAALLSVGVHPSATTAAAAAAAETTRHIVSVTEAIDTDNETLTTCSAEHRADSVDLDAMLRDGTVVATDTAG